MNKVGLVKFPSMILFCKNAKNAAKNDLLNPSQAYQWNSPNTTNTDFQYKASQNQEQYRDCTECSAIPWGTGNGCTHTQRSQFPRGKGPLLLQLDNWTMDIDCSCNSAPVIRYSAMTFNVTFFLFKFNAL